MRAILTYHSIDSTNSSISIGVESFARHVRWLASGRVRVTSVADLLTLPDTTDAVAITFDDAFQNLADVAAPMLASHGLPSTAFVVADHAGGTNAWARTPDPGIPVLPLLDWTGLARLAEQGVSIGAHSRSHRPLAILRGEELAEEIMGAGRIIERYTGRAPVGFAFPYGSVSDDAAAAVRGSYEWGCTTELQALRPGDDRARLPRLDMYYFRDPGRLERWGSARFNYYLQLRSRARRLRQRWRARRGDA
ncbi:MAG: polysaccharide deacetylase family protein [Gemmatimonadaceae bacterium]